MRLIDLNALLLELKKMESEYYASEFEEDNIMGLGVMMAIRKVSDAPIIEAEPVRHAQWEHLAYNFQSVLLAVQFTLKNHGRQTQGIAPSVTAHYLKI